MTSFRNFDTGYHLQKYGALSPHEKNFTKILQYILTVFMPICLNSNSGLCWISWLNNNLFLNFLNWIFSLFPTSDYSLCALLFPRFYYRLQKRTCLFGRFSEYFSLIHTFWVSTILSTGAEFNRLSLMGSPIMKMENFQHSSDKTICSGFQSSYSNCLYWKWPSFRSVNRFSQRKKIFSLLTWNY